MFKKILVANRGEIALRVIRACRELGIRTIAVYSEADEKSLHLALADEKMCIGPPRSAASYLDIAGIIKCARKSGAEFGFARNLPNTNLSYNITGWYV